MMPPIPPAADCRSMRFARRGLDLMVRVVGDAGKPPLILQHGARDHGHSLDFLGARFLGTHRIIIPDLRGHGDSGHVPGGGYEGIDYVADFVFLLRCLAGEGLGEVFDVIGHSLGGNIAAHAAAAAPCHFRRLVNIEGAGTPPDRYDAIITVPIAQRWAGAVTRRLGADQRAERRMKGSEEAVRKLKRIYSSAPDGIVEYVARTGVREDGEGVVWKYDPLLSLDLLRPEAPEEYAALYADVPCPVLLVYGRKSFATPPTEDGRGLMFPKGRLEIIEGAGHWPHHDRLDATIAVIRPFLLDVA